MPQPSVPIPGPITPPAPKPMGGWKMKLGSFLVAIAGVIGGSSEIVPAPEAAPWIKFAAFIVGGVGAAFLAWGAGHKIEKTQPVLVQKKTIPYYVHPLDEAEFKLLEDFRKQKKDGPQPPTIK